jgi:hypothetical protein
VKYDIDFFYLAFRPESLSLLSQEWSSAHGESYQLKYPPKLVRDTLMILTRAPFTLIVPKAFRQALQAAFLCTGRLVTFADVNSSFFLSGQITVSASTWTAALQQAGCNRIWATAHGQQMPLERFLLLIQRACPDKHNCFDAGKIVPTEGIPLWYSGLVGAERPSGTDNDVAEVAAGARMAGLKASMYRMGFKAGRGAGSLTIKDETGSGRSYLGYQKLSLYPHAYHYIKHHLKAGTKVAYLNVMKEVVSFCLYYSSPVHTTATLEGPFQTCGEARQRSGITTFSAWLSRR